MKYKTAFIDSDASKTSEWGIPKINGDDFARQISAALNEMALEGYELDQHIIINSSQSTLKEGVVLICKKKTNAKV